MAIPKVKPDADVIVVGGGIIGATFACLLGQAGLNVILLDAGVRQLKALKRRDARVFAITLASEKILTKAGAWRHLDKVDIAPFEKMRVWDEDGLGEINFNSATLCCSKMGSIIPHQAIVDSLQEELLGTENIRCLWSSSPAFIEAQQAAIVVGTTNNLQFTTKLVVAADGSHSKLRNLAGIRYQKQAYKQSVLACIVNTEHPHGQTARQRFLKRGPLAFLPMTDEHQCAIVWSSNPDHIQALQAMEPMRFHLELAEAFNHDLGKISNSTERTTFPLSRAWAEQYCKSRIALIGDSAHTIHPLAGLGANLGLLDAATLAETIIDTDQRGRDPGRLQVLRRYERRRQFENKNMMYIMHGFKHLFENQSRPIQWLRNVGLDMVDNAPLVKHAIMQRAMGLKGNLPAAARIVT